MQQDDGIPPAKPIQAKKRKSLRRQTSVKKVQQKRTPSEYAIQSLFTEFAKQAETMLNGLMSTDIDVEIDLGDYLRVGINKEFDVLLGALGSAAKHRPRIVIDAIMIWRKSKSEPIDPNSIKELYEGTLLPQKLKELQAVLKERKMLAANFILTRILMEVVKRLKPESLSQDLGSNLEEMIFGQLRAADPDTFYGSVNRIRNVDLFAELMGVMSLLRFAHVGDRFFRELDSQMNSKESKLEALIKSIRFVRLKLYPQEALDQTVEFLQELADSFKDAHSSAVKHAFSEAIIDLFTPLGAVVIAEVNIPVWMKSVDSIYQRALKMMSKPRHAHVAYSLATCMLVISKRDFFLSKWTQLLDMLFQRMKDRGQRQLMMDCACRLLWVYLYRCSEAITVTQKRLEFITKQIFPHGKKYVVPSEVALDPFVQIVHYMAVKHPEFTVKNVIFHLLPVDAIHSFTSYDQISPERAIIGLKAFVCLLDSGENTKPIYPWKVSKTPSGDEHYTAALLKSAESNEGATFEARYSEQKQKVCQLLGKMIKLLDQQLGNYLITDDKIKNSMTIGTVGTSYSSALSEAASTLTKDKQPYYDLMKAWMSLVPHLLPEAITEIELLDMLAKYLSHVDPDISQAAQETLQRYYLEFEAKTVLVMKSLLKTLMLISDKNPDMIERILKLYAETSSSYVSKAVEYKDEQEKLELFLTGEQNSSNTSSSMLLWSRLQEFESIGLLFLCNSFNSTRKLAIGILQLSARLYDVFLAKDTASKHDAPYLLRVLETSGSRVLKTHLNDYTRILPTYTERQNDVDFLQSIASSASISDQHIWLKVFPELIKQLFSRCPSVVDATFNLISSRLLNIHASVAVAADPGKSQNATLTSKWVLRQPAPASDELIEQWKLYFMFICASIMTSDPSWKGNKKKSTSSMASNSTGRIEYSQIILQMGLPLLSSEKPTIRSAVVQAFGNINQIVFQDLMEEIQESVHLVIEDMRSRYMRGSVRRVKKMERLRGEITHMFCIASDFVNAEACGEDVISFMVSYVREMGAFLSDQEVQTEWDHQMLRYYFCGFVERFYSCLVSSPSINIEAVFSFDLRYSLFKLFEEWCGYGQRGNLMREREARMILSVLEQVKDIRERGALTSAMEEQRKALEYAALRSMAALCKGLMQPKDKLVAKNVNSFSSASLFEWIQSVYTTADDTRLQVIARSALEGLLFHNQNASALWEDVLVNCYKNDLNSFNIAYFEAVANVLSHEGSVKAISASKMIALFLFKLANNSSDVRLRAFGLIRLIEERYLHHKFEEHSSESSLLIMVRGPTATVYLHAQTLICRELSSRYFHLSHTVLAELWRRLYQSESSSVMFDLLKCFPEWIENIELNLDEKYEEQHQHSALLLWNLLYFTVRLEQEASIQIQNIWARLSKGKNNIECIIHFLFQIGLEKRNGAFALLSRKVIAYIGKHQEAKRRLKEVLVGELSPKSMIPLKRSKKERFTLLEGNNQYFIAPLDEVLANDTQQKRSILSKGQLVLMLLSDFVLDSNELLKDSLAVLLQAVFVQLDHFNQLARDYSQLLLSGLLFTLVPPSSAKNELLKKLEEPLFSQQVYSNKKDRLNEELPTDIQELTKQVLKTFEPIDFQLQNKWGEKSLKWATSCPVRHVACRSLQLFQLLKPPFTSRMLSDVLCRLSNTAGDPGVDVQSFSREILKTLRLTFESLRQDEISQWFPTLFRMLSFVMSACSEVEYIESVALLKMILNRDRLSLVRCESIGLQNILIKGLTSQNTFSHSSELLDAVTLIADDSDVDNTPEDRLFNIMLINAVRCSSTSIVAYLQAKQLSSQAKLFESLLNDRYRTREDFFRQFIGIFREMFPKKDLKVYKFLLDLLSNKDKAFRIDVLKLLRAFLSHSNTKMPTLGFGNSKPEVTEKLEGIDDLSHMFLMPLLKLLLDQDTRQDALECLDDLIKLTLTEESSSMRILLSTRLLAKIKEQAAGSSGLVNILEDTEEWTWDEERMRESRADLTRLLNGFMLTQAKDKNEDEQVEEMNLDAIVEELDELDDFFTEDAVAQQDESMLMEGESYGQLNETFPRDETTEDESATELNEEYSTDEEDVFPLERMLSAQQLNDDVFSGNDENPTPPPLNMKLMTPTASRPASSPQRRLLHQASTRVLLYVTLKDVSLKGDFLRNLFRFPVTLLREEDREICLLLNSPGDDKEKSAQDIQRSVREDPEMKDLISGTRLMLDTMDIEVPFVSQEKQNSYQTLLESIEIHAAAKSPRLIESKSADLSELRLSKSHEDIDTAKASQDTSLDNSRRPSSAMSAVPEISLQAPTLQRTSNTTISETQKPIDSSPATSLNSEPSESATLAWLSAVSPTEMAKKPPGMTARKTSFSAFSFSPREVINRPASAPIKTIKRELSGSLASEGSVYTSSEDEDEEVMAIE